MKKRPRRFVGTVLKPGLSVWMKILSCAAFVCAALSISSVPTWAADNSQQEASPTTPPLLMPAMAGPLVANPKPTTFDLGPLGNWYITGVVSGLGLWQDNVAPGDSSTLADLDNAQVFIQKTEGLFQFYVQAGAYSLPDLGLPYIKTSKAIDAFYGPLPQAFVKLAPTDNFSISAGKLPTLIGAEYTFSFENMNVERGLLWNQENAVNNGVQLNYTTGPLALAFSWNDGFYSDRLSWVWGSATYTVDSANTISVVAGFNTTRTSISTTATPLFQNNEQIYNLIYTHTSGPWTLQPYFQYTFVPRIPDIGALHHAATYGGALLLKYTFDSDANVGGVSLAGFSLPLRLEYIASTGSVANGAPNLLYGPGSNAWSVTLTPTYQYKILFTRAEFSFVEATATTPGLAFGPGGTNTTQARLLLEAGILF